MTLFEGPLKTAIENTEGVVKQELVSYVIRDGMLYKETVTRRFQGANGDYCDHSCSEPLVYAP